MLSPEEFRNLDLRRRVGGYDRAQVDRLLEELREAYTAAWNERTRLHDQLLELRAELTTRSATIEELTAEVARLELAQASLRAEIDDLRALARVRSRAGELGESQEPGEAQQDPVNDDRPETQEGDTAPQSSLRDLPFDALTDYVMQRFEFHNRTDHAKETE